MSDRIQTPDGKSYEVQTVDFSTVREEWNEYRLEDGTRVRFKAVVQRIAVAVDDEGNRQRMEDGQVIVAVASHNLVVATSPEGH